MVREMNLYSTTEGINDKDRAEEGDFRILSEPNARLLDENGNPTSFDRDGNPILPEGVVNRPKDSGALEPVGLVDFRNRMSLQEAFAPVTPTTSSSSTQELTSAPTSIPTTETVPTEDSPVEPIQTKNETTNSATNSDDLPL